MSTGKRLAKRSILGTRVACRLDDGKYYPGVICKVKTSPFSPSAYSMRIEGETSNRELKETALVGSGFTPVNCVKLRADQKVYITHNQREVIGAVIYHRPNIDEVLISVINPENGVQQEVKKRLDEIRLLESRKSARLADQDTDFAKLADCASERMNRKSSSIIDVPVNGLTRFGSLKRRIPRYEDEPTDACAAALVLMKLSASPRSPLIQDAAAAECVSGGSSVSSGVWSLCKLAADGRSASPSPPLSDASPPHAAADDGIQFDDLYEQSDAPRKRRSSARIMFKCTWKGCNEVSHSSNGIEQHIRQNHLGRRMICSDSESDSEDDHEEEFYWTEVEVGVATPVEPMHTAPAQLSPTTFISPSMHVSPLSDGFSLPTGGHFFPTPPHAPSFAALTTSIVPTPSPTALSAAHVALPFEAPSYSFVSPQPTLSHMDMARPAHEDPDYGMHRTNSPSILSSSWPCMSSYLAPGKIKARTSTSPKGSGGGRGKRGGESRKCRKVYGMEQKDQWCTQCKWKKACSRFSE